MKKSLLIILMSLLGFTGFAQLIPGFVDGCISHKVPTGGTVVHHFYVITLDATAAGAPMELYMNSTGPYAQASAPVLIPVLNNWVYEFDLGPLGMIDFDCRNVQVFPVGMPYDPNVPFNRVCHCDWSIKDACIKSEVIGNQVCEIVTVVFDADVQGLNKTLWYWTGVSMVGFNPMSKTFVNGQWVYKYNLFSLTSPLPIDLYVSDNMWTIPNVSDPHFTANYCEAKPVYACYDYVPDQGVNQLYVTVIYGPGIAGMNAYLWWFNGTFNWGIPPITKTFVNGYWKYVYYVGYIFGPQPQCYDVYTTMTPVPPTPAAQHYMACKCGCDATFGYCVNPDAPYKILFDLDMPNPTATIEIKVDGTVVYTGPAINGLSHDFGAPGVHNVCIKMNDDCEYCLDICIAEQSTGE